MKTFIANATLLTRLGAKILISRGVKFKIRCMATTGIEGREKWFDADDYEIVGGNQLAITPKAEITNSMLPPSGIIAHSIVIDGGSIDPRDYLQMSWEDMKKETNFVI